jgi:hypothetical protein
MKRTFAFSLSTALVMAASAAAQQVTVQLPSQQVFSVGTTVTVPDRGEALLGGVSRASTGSNNRGTPLLGKIPGTGPLFRSRGIGQSMGASNVSVRATIIDQQEMDEAVLAEAAARRGATGDSLTARQSAFLSHNMGGPLATEAPATRIVHFTPTPALPARENPEAEGKELLQRGQQAEADGKISAARIFYRMAARRLGGEQGEQLLAHAASLVEQRSADRVAARPE